MMQVDIIPPAQTTEAAMQAAGIDTEESLYEDYFGFEETRKYLLPDGKQWIEFRIMNEGDRSLYQKNTSRDLKMDRRTEETTIKVDQAADRHALIQSSVVGWHMMSRNRATGTWEPVAFNNSPGGSFAQWMNKADPKIIDQLFKELHLANPWLMGERTIEEIDKEIVDLQQLRDAKVKADREKEDSSSR